MRKSSRGRRWRARWGLQFFPARVAAYSAGLKLTLSRLAKWLGWRPSRLEQVENSSYVSVQAFWEFWFTYNALLEEGLAASGALGLIPPLN